ncbi:MAG: hypothetical protein IPK81_02155 [Rhodospirillales bacterium]|nr:MAG: hypothetical protein IPK81_02155 [Rhodospirillales bacterium]
MANYVYAGAAPVVSSGGRSGATAGGLFRIDPATSACAALAGGLPADVEVRAVVVVPGDPRTVYAGTQAGLYVSRDAGDTWTSLGLPGDDKVVWSILLHPKDPRTIYVGTQGTTVHRSRDGGATWRELDIPEPAGMVRMAFACRVIRLAIDPGSPDTLYAAFEVGGLSRSLDGGDTWEGCNSSLLEFTKEPRLRSRIVSDTETEGMMDSHALAVSPKHPGTVYLANRMGLFRSDDRAGRFGEVGIGRFSPLTYARDVVVSPHDPDTLYAALSVAAISDEGSLYRSRDFGASWTRFDSGVAMESTLMTIAPSAAHPARVYCATRRGQVFGTEDGGASWREFRLPPTAQGVYAVATA